jgi:hypothetical protein
MFSLNPLTTEIDDADISKFCLLFFNVRFNHFSAKNHRLGCGGGMDILQITN